jgi:hypothetical protein
MSKTFDRDALLDAFDKIGCAAVAADTRLQIAVYGGSALMLASNFRFATEDVDIAEIGIAEIGPPWPAWLSDLVERIAQEKGWSATWLNDGCKLSSQCTGARQTRPHCFWHVSKVGRRRRTYCSHPNRLIQAGLEAQGLEGFRFRKRSAAHGGCRPPAEGSQSQGR